MPGRMELSRKVFELPPGKARGAGLNHSASLTNDHCPSSMPWARLLLMGGCEVSTTAC